MKTQAIAAATGLKTVILLKPHEDAGVVLPVDSELDLPPTIADWLIKIETAKAK